MPESRDNPGNTSMHTLTLSFPGGLEAEFRDDYFRRSLGQVRIAHIQSIFLYAFFALLDPTLMPEAYPVTWIIRFAIVCPTLFLFFILTFSAVYRRIMQQAISFLVLLVGTGCISMLWFSNMTDGEVAYTFPGVMLVIANACTFCRLRFVYAAPVSLLLLAQYVIGLRLNAVPMITTVNSCTHLISITCIGLFACYHFEKYARGDYLRRLAAAGEERRREEVRHAAEKEKIVRHLHDGIGGIITNIKLLSDMGAAGKPDAEPAHLLNSISGLSNVCLAELRTFMDLLDTKEMDWQGLAADMCHLGGSMVESHGLEYTFRCSSPCPASPPDVFLAVNLMLIYREALTNVIKHSGATRVHVSLDFTPAAITMSIADDGIWETQEKAAGRGLASMRDRAWDLGGTLEIEIENGKGTRVFLSIPIPEKYPIAALDL